MKRATREHERGAVLITVLLVMLFMLFVFITLLSMFGGALGAKFVGRNPQSEPRP